MTVDRHETRLRAALADLRAAERREAPSFERVVGLTRPKGGRSIAGPVVRLGLVAALAIAAAITYRSVTARRARLTVPEEVAALVAWRPMTGALLETPGQELLAAPPPLGASVLDIGTGGDRR